MRWMHRMLWERDGKQARKEGRKGRGRAKLNEAGHSTKWKTLRSDGDRLARSRSIGSLDLPKCPVYMVGGKVCWRHGTTDRWTRRAKSGIWNLTCNARRVSPLSSSVKGICGWLAGS